MIDSYMFCRIQVNNINNRFKVCIFDNFIMTIILMISIMQYINDHDLMSLSNRICFIIEITHLSTKTMAQSHIAISR